MAIAFDAATELESVASTDPLTFSHTPVGTPKGAIVAICHGVLSADNVAGVTYGGVAMTRIRTDADTVTEPGRTYLYFLGSSVPTGTQTVSVDWTTGNTNAKHLNCLTFTAVGDTTSIANGGLSEDRANPSVTLAYTGKLGIAVAIDYTGTAAPGTAGANTTLVNTYDMAAFGSAVVRQTTPGTADFAVSVTHVSDDCAFSAMAIGQVTEDVAALPGVVHARTRV